MNNLEIEIPHFMQRRNIVTQTKWTAEELIPHVAKRANILSDEKLGHDIDTSLRVINAQSIHLENSSRALVDHALDLYSDLKKKGY